MIYREEQKARPPLFAAVGCICLCEDNLLLLKRADDKSYPRTWGVPTGKLKAGEVPLQGMIRELYEETSVLLSAENLEPITTFHIVTAEFSFRYSLYLCRFAKSPSITLCKDEHTEFRWVTPNDALRMDLVPDLGECLIAILPTITAPVVQQLDLFTGRPSPTAYPVYRLKASHDNEKASLEYLMGGPAAKTYYASLGPPCAGKTSAFKIMADQDSRLCHTVDSTPLQKTSYQNFYLRKAFEERDHRFFFHFQIDSLATRFWHTITAPHWALVDETIYTTLAYSRALFRLGWIAEYEYKAFHDHYRLYHALLPKPTKVYYFFCAENILIERLRERAKKKSRLHEAFYLAEYVDALSYAFAEVARELAHDDGLTIVSIDSSKLSPGEIAGTYAPKHLD